MPANRLRINRLLLLISLMLSFLFASLKFKKFKRFNC
nr:MAG TPA: hypothetical protein [Caudoviricetes sp.]